MDPMQLLTFPILANEEIVECMNELGIPVIMGDLSKPNGHHMRKVYESFLDLLMGVTRETFEQPGFDVESVLEMPELHLQSIADMSCFHALREMMLVVGVADFSLKDVLKPEPDRVAYILSGLINFGKFREMQLVNFEQLTEKTDQLAEKKKALDLESAELTEKLDAAQKQRAVEEPFSKDLQKELATLATTVASLHTEQESLQSEFQTIKQSSSELATKLAALKTELTGLQADNAKLSSHIVESPDRLKQTMNEMSAGLRKEQEAVLGYEKKMRETSAKIESLTLVEQELDRCVKLLNECEAEMQRFEEVQRQVTAGQENVSRSEANIRDMSLKEQQLKRQLQSSEEKFARLKRQQSMRREAFEARIRALRQDQGMLAGEQMAQRRQVQELDELISRTETKTAELKQAHGVEMAALRSEYLQLKQTVEMYHTKLLAAITSV